MTVDFLSQFVIFLNLWLQICKATAADNITVQARNSYINVKWHAVGNSDKYEVSIQVMGTGYHSDVEVHGTQNEANITTILYPGSNYILKLYAVHNGTKSLFGTRFIRSACGDKFNTTLGSQYIILSPSYPNGYNAGVVCRWYFYGNYVTWFKVILWDYDIEGTEKCSNSLQVSDAPTLCHPVERNHFLVVKNSSMSLQMMNKFTGPGRGMNVSVVAFHSIDQPRNIVANLSSHDLHLTWIPPLLHPNNFTYMLYISFPPYHGDDLVHMIPADQNEYRLNVSDHIGQMLVIGISAKSPELESNRTYANIYFACSTNIHIPPEGVIFVTSPRYPLGFHAGVNCRWYVYTEPDFFILVTRADIDIGGTGGCTDAYIDITSLGKHCVAIESGSVIPANSVNISFSSGSITSGRGFNITVESVAKPSDPPEHVLGVVNHTHIHVTWGEPPRRSQHIIGFFVEYFIAPHTLGASLYTERGTREAFISTEHQSGKMFIIRVASVTKGGKGNYSNPLYVRSVCETTVTLSQHQTSLIFSPLVNNNGNYQPGIVCKWIIQTAEPLWLQITIEKFALEQSTGCSKDYLEISGHRKLCGQIWNQSFLLKKTSTNITFVSDFDTEDSGFVIAVSAVGPPPGLPQNVSVVSSQYGLICTWDSPKQNEMYVIGYHLTYIIHPERTNHTVEIARDTRLYAIDTTYIPGRLIEVYIQAKGDVESGPTSRSELARSSCGQDYSLTKGRRLYISSPKFPSQYDISVSCNWSIMLADLYSVRLSFITLDLINMEGHNCSNDYVKISGLGVFCDKAVENSQFILQSIQRIQITFESDETGNGKGFLLQLDVINDHIKSTRHEDDHHYLSSELYSSASDMDLGSMAVAYTHIDRTHGTYSHNKSSIQTSHPPEIVPSFVSYGDHAFASRLQRGSSAASYSLLPESSSAMKPFRNISGKMVHAVSFSILSSSDFAYLAVNDFSLSTSQLAMAMSTEVIGSISSLPRDSFTESFSFLPESSSVMSPFVSYVDNRIHTASSFASSTLDDALLYENGFSVSTSQHSMTMSMPFSHIHQIILTSTDEDLIQKLNATSVVKEYSELVVGHTVFKSAYRAMSTTYNHTATGSIAQSLAFITETFCEKTASLYKSSDLKETIIEVASSSKTLDVNYPVSNTMISYLETVYGLSSTNSFISNTKTDVEMSSSTALILPTALFNSQSLLIIGTFYSNVYSTKTSNIPTITVSSYTRKPSNQSLSDVTEAVKVNGSNLRHFWHIWNFFTTWLVLTVFM